MTFISAWLSVAAACHETACRKGWWQTERNGGEAVALMHSELSEALEAMRHGNPPSEAIPGFSQVEEELADLIIRVMDFAQGRKLNLAEAILAKMKYNEGRPLLHGKVF